MIVGSAVYNVVGGFEFVVADAAVNVERK